MLSSPERFDWFRAPMNPHGHWVLAAVHPRDKRSGREADHLTRIWYLFLSVCGATIHVPLCLRAEHRGSFTTTRTFD